MEILTPFHFHSFVNLSLINKPIIIEKADQTFAVM